MGHKVTIGVCVRNSEKFVKEAIDGIMSQDFPHDQVKVVFVDDGSEDRTLLKIQECSRGMNMTSAILHTSWKGLGNARNMVMSNADGEYILWVDGDMALAPDFLRRLVEFMDKNPKAAISKGRQALSRGHNLLATLETFSRAAGRMVDYQSQRGKFKSLGTGGALYRTKAIKDAGGFDNNLKWYNEDWDAEIRLRKAGWSLHTVDVTFHDYERHGLTWQSLWRRYWVRGYHTRYFLHKNKGMVKHYRMFPPAACLSGLFSSFTLYKLTRQKVVFLLPFQSTFKMTAWYVGFIRSHQVLRP